MCVCVLPEVCRVVVCTVTTFISSSEEVPVKEGTVTFLFKNIDQTGKNWASSLILTGSYMTAIKIKS